MSGSTTLLVIAPAGVPPYSARGLKQSLAPIGAATALRRTVNGTLVDLSDPAFRKYVSTISCTDQQAPAVDGVWPGDTVTVDCVVELAREAGTGDAGAGRSVVPGSEREEGDFVFYRPRLTMIVTAYQVTRDEYGAATDWTMTLEEA